MITDFILKNFDSNIQFSKKIIPLAAMIIFFGYNNLLYNITIILLGFITLPFLTFLKNDIRIKNRNIFYIANTILFATINIIMILALKNN